MLVLSTSLALVAGIAIAALGAPLWLLVVVSWGGAMFYGAAVSWLDRRVGRR